MGIDVYAKWLQQTAEEEESQITGFSTVDGDKGYLREAYHGGPYVTKFLVEEAFGDECTVQLGDKLMFYDDLTNEQRDNGNYKCLGVRIEAKKMRERLPAAVLLAMYRQMKIYGRGENVGTGDISELGKMLIDIFTMQMNDNSHRIIAGSFTPEMLKLTEEKIEKRNLPDNILSFVDFVELAEKVEARTGEPVFVYVSA